MFGIDDAALAMVLAGGISTAGALYANSANRAAAKNANLANLQVARENNAAQIEMANTAHQREVADLRAAGLNPILSAGGSGASTPTLQSPSIDPVHMDNAFEGLANSARGVSRYLSEQYKNGLAQQRADEFLTRKQAGESVSRQDWTDLQSTMLRQQIHRQANRMPYDVAVDRVEAENDLTRAMMERAAMKYEYGIEPRTNKHGDIEFKYHSHDAFSRSLNLAREGLRSDLKVRANQNWRNNLSSFVPFTSPAAVNSAATAAQRTRALLRK